MFSAPTDVKPLSGANSLSGITNTKLSFQLSSSTSAVTSCLTNVTSSAVHVTSGSNLVTYMRTSSAVSMPTRRYATSSAISTPATGTTNITSIADTAAGAASVNTTTNKKNSNKFATPVTTTAASIKTSTSTSVSSFATTKAASFTIANTAVVASTNSIVMSDTRRQLEKSEKSQKSGSGLKESRRRSYSADNLLIIPDKSKTSSSDFKLTSNASQLKSSTIDARGSTLYDKNESKLKGPSVTGRSLFGLHRKSSLAIIKLKSVPEIDQDRECKNGNKEGVAGSKIPIVLKKVVQQNSKEKSVDKNLQQNEQRQEKTSPVRGRRFFRISSFGKKNSAVAIKKNVTKSSQSENNKLNLLNNDEILSNIPPPKPNLKISVSPSNLLPYLFVEDYKTNTEINSTQAIDESQKVTQISETVSRGVKSSVNRRRSRSTSELYSAESQAITGAATKKSLFQRSHSFLLRLGGKSRSSSAKKVIAAKSEAELSQTSSLSTSSSQFKQSSSHLDKSENVTTLISNVNGSIENKSAQSASDWGCTESTAVSEKVLPNRRRSKSTSVLPDLPVELDQQSRNSIPAIRCKTSDNFKPLGPTKNTYCVPTEAPSLDGLPYQADCTSKEAATVFSNGVSSQNNEIDRTEANRFNSDVVLIQDRLDRFYSSQKPFQKDFASREMHKCESATATNNQAETLRLPDLGLNFKPRGNITTYVDIRKDLQRINSDAHSSKIDRELSEEISQRRTDEEYGKTKLSNRSKSSSPPQSRISRAGRVALRGVADPGVDGQSRVKLSREGLGTVKEERMGGGGGEFNNVGGECRLEESIGEQRTSLVKVRLVI